MSHTMSEKKITALYTSLGVQSLDDLTPMAKGIGAKVTKAEDTLSAARETLATLVPILLGYSAAAFFAGTTAKVIGATTGYKDDQAAKNIIAGILFTQGADPFQARTDVDVAVANGASKPALRAAALESVKAFRAVAADAASTKAAKAAEGTEASPKVTEGTEGASTEKDAAKVVTLHDHVLAISGPASSIVKAYQNGQTLDDADREALKKILTALLRETQVIPFGKVAAPKVAKSA
jgi:hypothetical protein